MSRGSLAGAIAASVGIILSGPFIDLVRGAVRAAFPEQFASIVGAVVGMAVVVALVVAVGRICSRRGLRHLALAAAVAIGIAYAYAVRTGNAEADAVERVHFIEHGLLAVLFFRAWRGRGDWSIVLLPALAAWLVGTLDESLQWWIPIRVGEAHDVFLNGAAIACGLLIGFAFDPPPLPLGPWQSGSLTLASTGGAIVIATFALFLYMVHLGEDVWDEDGNTFRSQWSGVDLVSAAQERAERWRVNPPRILHRLSREDHYLSEGLWHLQARNKASSLGHVRAAWGENRILEEFSAPVLDLSRYAGQTSHRWTSGQLENTRALVTAPREPYASDANPYPIYTWSRLTFWTITIAAGTALALVGMLKTERPVRPRIRPGDPG